MTEREYVQQIFARRKRNRLKRKFEDKLEHNLSREVKKLENQSLKYERTKQSPRAVQNRPRTMKLMKIIILYHILYSFNNGDRTCQAKLARSQQEEENGKSKKEI